MAPEGGRSGSGVGSPPLLARLFAEPQRFEFFQAVRILEHAWRERARADPAWHRGAVGGDEAPRREVVRFRTLPSLRFPGTAVAALEESRTAEGQRPSDAAPPVLTVTFAGLLGPHGALPDHYTELVIRRARFRDRTLRDFLDMFQHRVVSLFHRAWEKYRFPVLYERAAAMRGESDTFTWALYCLVGLGTEGLRHRLEVHDEAFLWHAGHFARRPRPAVALEAVLSDYFELPVRVRQFQGEWLTLPADERTVLPSAAEPRGRHNRLSQDTIVGSHAWDVQGRFGLRVGPVPYSVFRRFMPTGDLLRPFCQMVRAFAGPEFAYDTTPVLLPNEAPPCCLGSDHPDTPRLGWNTWLRTNPIPVEFDGVAFSLPEV